MERNSLRLLTVRLYCVTNVLEKSAPVICVREVNTCTMWCERWKHSLMHLSHTHTHLPPTLAISYKILRKNVYLYGSSLSVNRQLQRQTKVRIGKKHMKWRCVNISWKKWNAKIECICICVVFFCLCWLLFVIISVLEFGS